MIQDFKFAFRQLIKTPGFTAIAVLTLAIAIGVNSAVFALVNGVILRPVVPLRPAEVVNVFTARQGAAHDYRPFSYNEFSTLRENNDVFADVAAMQFALAGIGRDEGMRRSFVFLTSSNFFSLMGVKPVVGRFYDAAECRPDANIPVVVASYPYWKKLGGTRGFHRQTTDGQWADLHLDRGNAGWFRGHERLARTRSLVAARRLFAARLGLQRHERQDGTDRAEELHAQSDRPDASWPNDRFDQAAPAGAGQTTDRGPAARCDRRARVANPGAIAFQHQHHAVGRRAGWAHRHPAARDGRSGPAHRLSQSGQYAPRARGESRQGNRAPTRARRESLADR